MNPEVKIILHVHEEALASAPSPDELKALLGIEPSHFVVERRTITKDRTRSPAMAKAETLEDQLVAWLAATYPDIDTPHYERLCLKLAEVAA